MTAVAVVTNICTYIVHYFCNKEATMHALKGFLFWSFGGCGCGQVVVKGIPVLRGSQYQTLMAIRYLICATPLSPKLGDAIVT
jgi:hypothetical protein